LVVVLVQIIRIRYLATEVSLKIVVLGGSQVHSTMSENTDVSAVAADALHSAVDNASDLPASTSAPSDRYVSAPQRLFNRDKSVHQLLGGGQGEILVSL
jgi:hypothetical protein